MDNFKIDRIISTFKAQLLVQEQMEPELDDKISITSKSARVPKATMTQVYSIILSLIAQVERMDTDNAEVVDPKKSCWAASTPASYRGSNELTCVIFITTHCYWMGMSCCVVKYLTPKSTR